MAFRREKSCSSGMVSLLVAWCSGDNASCKGASSESPHFLLDAPLPGVEPTDINGLFSLWAWWFSYSFPFLPPHGFIALLVGFQCAVFKKPYRETLSVSVSIMFFLEDRKPVLLPFPTRPHIQQMCWHCVFISFKTGPEKWLWNSSLFRLTSN